MNKVPDINANVTVAAGALTTLVIYIASLFGATIPGEVGSAITTLAAVIFGFFAGTSSPLTNGNTEAKP